ncbi:reverse transcriptase domain-containing protein [Tanacetum coccineum]
MRTSLENKEDVLQDIIFGSILTICGHIRSSSHDTLAPSSEFPLPPVVAPPRIRRWPTILIRPGEAIPFGRPYRTHPNWPRKLLTARKRVGPFPTRRLAWRRVSHRSLDRHSLSDFTSDSYSSGSSSDSSLDTSSGSPSNLLSDTSSVHSSGCNASDLGISDRVIVDTEEGIGIGVKIASSDIKEDEEEFETANRQFEAGQLMASKENRVDSLRHHMALSHEEFRHIRRDHDDSRRRLRRLESFVERLMGFRPYRRRSFRISSCAMSCVLNITITRFEMTPEAIEELIAQRVAEVLANYEATRVANALETENQSQNGTDSDNGNGGNGDGGNNGNGNLIKNGRGAMPVARMETVFHISNFPKVYQVKYATCMLQDSALTCWTSHKRTTGVDVAFSMTWRDLMKLITEVYCPRNKIQKMETKLWNLTVKNNDLATYTQRFQELILLCTIMVPGEEDRIKRYVGGLPDNIQGNVMSTEPTRLQDAIRLANSLMDQKLKGYAIRSAENK